MDVLAKVRAELNKSPLGSEKRQSLRYILGELSSVDAPQSRVGILSRLLEDSEKSQRRVRNPKELERIRQEITILRDLLGT